MGDADYEQYERAAPHGAGALHPKLLPRTHSNGPTYLPTYLPTYVLPAQIYALPAYVLHPLLALVCLLSFLA